MPSPSIITSGRTEGPWAHPPRPAELRVDTVTDLLQGAAATGDADPGYLAATSSAVGAT